MFIRFPKDDKYFSWTRHIKNKMIFYGLSEQRIRNIFRSPDRREEGIAPSTVAVMKKNHKKNRKEEIWLMFQKKSNLKSQISNLKVRNPSSQRLLASRLKVTMISAWRYPGVSKPGKAIPIPDDILEELQGVL